MDVEFVEFTEFVEFGWVVLLFGSTGCVIDRPRICNYPVELYHCAQRCHKDISCNLVGKLCEKIRERVPRHSCFGGGWSLDTASVNPS